MVPDTVIHVPHASLYLPQDWWSKVLVEPAVVLAHLKKLTDIGTDRLASYIAPEAAIIISPVSRLVVDVERYADSSVEPMARVGMGVIYTCTMHGHPLRESPHEEERQALLNRWYHPHHERLTAAVQAALDAHGRCLLIDLHSYSKDPLPHEWQPVKRRPYVCLGTDTFHTPRAFVENVKTRIFCAGIGVEENTPFSGTLVPDRFRGKDPRVTSVMLELRKDWYLKRDLTLNARAPGIASFLGHTVREAWNAMETP